MLALAIISTVILAAIIIMFFIAGSIEQDNSIAGLIMQLLLGFVIAAIWILYAR